jgi:ketosteroid isomerase-like protein
MDSVATLAPSIRESGKLAVVRQIWDEWATGGPAAAAAVLFAHSDEDIELRAGIGGVEQRVRGHEQIRSALPESPLRILGAKPYSFSEEGDDVIVSAWVRMRENGGYVDAQVRWRYRFREGRIVEVSTLPFAHSG